MVLLQHDRPVGMLVGPALQLANQLMTGAWMAGDVLLNQGHQQLAASGGVVWGCHGKPEARGDYRWWL